MRSCAFLACASGFFKKSRPFSETCANRARGASASQYNSPRALYFKS